MKNNLPFFLLDEKEYRSLCHDFVESLHHQVRAKRTKNTYYSFLRLFRRWMIGNKHIHLNENTIKLWMLDCSQRMAVETIQTEVSMVAHFLDYLISRNLWHENPCSTLREQHRTRGYCGIARVLKKTGSITALDELADTPFSGALAHHFTDYLNHVRALGKSVREKTMVLQSFEKCLRQQNINNFNQLRASVLVDWNNRFKGATRKRSRLLDLKQFFDFLLAQERIHVSPVPQLPPPCRWHRPPYIFSQEQVRNILAAAEKLPDHRFMPYRGPTYRMVFLSLYTLGLRISEALNCRVADIDFVQNSVTIRDTKFHKGRVLPFGPRFKEVLHRYITKHPLLRKESDFLFQTEVPRSIRLSNYRCYRILHTILQELSIKAPLATQSPGLHSLRHAFAVHRLEKWMREGADVNSKLTLLSAFLGHTDIACTQVYLTMTPQRLVMLGERFEKAFGMPPQTDGKEERP